VKTLLAIVTVSLALAFVTGCYVVGWDRNVSISFDWTYTPEWFDTDDPHLPSTIYRNVEYLTEEGTWYFEYYHAESGIKRWIWYTLTANYGCEPCVPVEDARFELFLHAFSDPAFIRWQSVIGEAAEEPDSMSASGSPMHPEEQRTQTFERTMTSGGWSLELRGGVIEPSDW
jgi:hypothetical protein